MKKSFLILPIILFSLAGCEHQHTFSKDWDFDAYSHWHSATCEHTNLKKDDAEHTFDDNNKCVVCGYDKTHIHEYHDYWSENDEYHWHECSCGDKKDYAKHNYVDGYCVCGKSEPKPYVQITINGTAYNASQYDKGNNIFEISNFVVEQLTNISFAYKTWNSLTEYNDVVIESNEYAVTSSNGVVRIPVPAKYKLRFDLTEGVRKAQVVECKYDSYYFHVTLFHVINGARQSPDSISWNQLKLDKNYYELKSHVLSLNETIPFEIKFAYDGKEVLTDPIVFSKIELSDSTGFEVLPDKTGVKYIGEPTENKYQYFLRYDLTTLEPSLFVQKNVG